MPVIPNASLRDYSYYRTGGRCAELYLPESTAELAAIVRELERRGQRYFLLGGGTNSLVLDEVWDGAVIAFARLARLEALADGIVAGAGVDNSEIARLAHQRGLAGAAWMNRLPGQIGGTVRMNARCYGGEIGRIVRRVTAVSKTGEILVYPGGPSVFRGYKDTAFMESGEIVAEVELALQAGGDPAVILAEMERCENDRVRKGQFDFPSCGCVFKNDHALGVTSGLMLDAAGAKNLRVGGGAVSPHHANFVYNRGASSQDILEVSFAMRELVYQHFGVWMEYEMEVLGELPVQLKARISEVRRPMWNETALAPLRERMRR